MNRKLKALVAGVALVAMSPLAALALDATAFIQLVDRDARTVFLDNGDWVMLPADFDIATIAPGSRIMISYDNTGDEPYTATSVSLVGTMIEDIRNNELPDTP